MNSGRTANATGNRAEEAVRQILLSQGYEFIKDHDFFALHQVSKQSLFTAQAVVGENIYGKGRKADFVVYHPRKWPACLVIESKWQASTGTVDEKYPFVVLTIHSGDYDSVIVLDGGGYSVGAKKWLEEQAGKGRLRQVLDIGGFQRWAKGNL